MNGPPRILITRLSHIGDCILTLPMAVELKRQFPDSNIVWACESPGSSLIRNHPAVDEVIEVPRNWFRSPRTVIALRRSLRSYGFDYSMDPQGLLKSALLARLSGARTRVGFTGEHGREFSQSLNNQLIAPRTSHLVDRSLDLLHALPLTRAIEKPEFRFEVQPAARESIGEFLKQLTFPCYCVLNPGASWPSKLWDTARFGAVARYLFEEYHLVPVVTWAGDAESRMADEIVRGSGGLATKAPRTNLGELAAILDSADFFVGCDTGPLHLAVAVNTPCIGLYGPTRPECSGAYGMQHIVLQRRYQAGSRRERRRADNAAMLEISTHDVFHAVDAMMNRLLSKRHAG